MDQKKEKMRVVLTGGGSGGHVIPTLAVQKSLVKKYPCFFLYIGQRNGVEKKFAEQSNIPFVGIFAGKLRRYFDIQNFIDPFKVIIGIIQSFFYLLRFKPHVIFAKGGYVSLPVSVAGFFLRIPVIIHESDVIPGLANRIANTFARKTLISFEETKKHMQFGIFTGSPVRTDLKPIDKKQADDWREKGYAETKFTKKNPVILILGGSLGAENVNQKIYKLLPQLKDKCDIILQTGKGKMDSSYNKYSNLKQYEFINEELKYFYQMADIVISRAGANVLFELALLGKATILIPLGTKGSRGDQLLNAKEFTKKEACLIHHNSDDAKNLYNDIIKLIKDPSYRRYLEKNIIEFSPKEASNEIATEILKILNFE